MNNPRYLNTIYCDDVRLEVGGKTTYVGVYGSVMNIVVSEEAYKQNNGVTIPKLCLISTLSTPADQPAKKIDFSIKLDGKPVQGFSTELQTPPESSNAQYQTCTTVNNVSLTLRQPSLLSLTASIDGGEAIEGPTLLLNLQVKKSETAPEANTPAPETQQ